jgi:hypothetical protein
MAHRSTRQPNRKPSFQDLHRQLAELVYESRELNARERAALADIGRRIFENEERRARPPLRLVA